MKFTTLLRITLTGAGLCSAFLAVAGQTWTVADPSGSYPNDGNYNANGCMRSAGGGAGNSITCDKAPNGPVSAAFTGWATNGNTGTSTFSAAYLSNQGNNGAGLYDGIESTNSPYHAFDSINNSELMRIAFSSAVSLEKVSLGWYSGDADVSVFAYTGTGAPASLAGKTVNGATGLVAAGWTLVGQYGFAGSAPDIAGGSGNDNDLDIAVNAGKVSSSYWLVAAMNSSFATGGSGGLGLDAVPDAWKFLGVTGSRATLPEPGSLALVCLALVGAAGARRARPSSP